MTGIASPLPQNSLVVFVGNPTHIACMIFSPFVADPTPVMELAVFPLRGVLLLPGGRLPLNIFEPRYLQMVSDCLGQGRLLGMIQLQADNQSLYTTGCAGRIVHFEETDDGRFVIILTGLARFRVAAEIPDSHPYRMVQPDWAPFAKDIHPAAALPMVDRRKLESVFLKYCGKADLQVDQQALQDAPLERLLTVLPMICPFSPEEKQALLEAPTLTERGAMLLALLEMGLHNGMGCNDRPQLN